MSEPNDLEQLTKQIASDQEFALATIIRVGNFFAAQGEHSEALRYWAAAAKYDVLDAVFNSVLMCARLSAESQDFEVKCAYGDYVDELLTPERIVRLDVADIPSNAGAMFLDIAATASREGLTEYAAACCAKAATYFEHALHVTEVISELEQPTALNGLARLYLEGSGVEKDPVKAYKLFELAATQLHFGEAMFNLGIMRYHGLGCERNPVEALSWFERADAHIPDDYFNPLVKVEAREAVAQVAGEIAGTPVRPKTLSVRSVLSPHR